MANVSSSNGLEKYPKLRFPGFDEPWKVVELSSVLKERNEFAEKDGSFEHTTLSKDGIFGKTARYDRDFLVSTENKKYKVTHINDLCYNPANLKFGVICLNKYGDAIFSPIYVTFEIQSDYDADFVGENLSRWDFINKALRYQQGTVYERMAVSPEDFLSIKCYMPSKREQEKLSRFIGLLDEKIVSQQKYIDNLKKYKRGVSNAIFSRKIRFKQKDGTEYPEWDTKQLSELMEFKNGVNAQKDAFLKGNIKCIGVSDVYSGKPIYSCNIMGSIKLDSDQKREFLVEYGDVLFQRSSETQEDIGHAAVYVDESQMSVFNGFVIRGKKKAEYDPWFLHYELQTSDVRKQTIRLGAGAQHYNIGQESLASIIVRLPSADEQNKIAHLLKSIDARITVEESKIKTLQMAKDGLMQKLFV